MSLRALRVRSQCEDRRNTVDLASSAALSWQGVALGEGLIFVGSQTGTKSKLWTKRPGSQSGVRPSAKFPLREGESVTGAPTYWKGVVFAGLANGDWALRGRVVALDAKTGRELWHFFTVPGPGEAGHDSWDQQNNVWKIGGGGVWQTGAVDPSLGLVYFVTGNPIPPFGGEERPGNNLFTCTVLALEMKTGKLRWHYQLIHHDVWEGDIATPLLLYDTRAGGELLKGAGIMRADWVFVFIESRDRPAHFSGRRASRASGRAHGYLTHTTLSCGSYVVLPDCDKWRTTKIPSGFEVGCFSALPTTTSSMF